MDTLNAEADQLAEAPKTRTPESMAMQASRLLGEVSQHYRSSVTAQAAEIARRFKGSESQPEYISPAELGKHFLLSKKAVSGFVERAHSTHINAAIAYIKNDGREATPLAIEQYMQTKSLPSHEVIENRVRGIIGDTFNLAQRMLILSPTELEEILKDYKNYHNLVIKPKEDPEESYRFLAEEKIIQAVTRQEANSSEQATEPSKATHRFQRGMQHFGRKLASAIMK